MRLRRLVLAFLLSIVVGVLASSVSKAAGFDGVQFGTGSPSLIHLVQYYDDTPRFSFDELSWPAAGIATNGVGATETGLMWVNTLSISGLAAADTAAGDGLVYLRTDATGLLEPYVGQTSSATRFIARQAEHHAAYPDSVFNCVVQMDYYASVGVEMEADFR